jgi:asparagine synthase (glutamine-hydrolysing)
MIQTLRNRGPDGWGEHYVDDHGLALGHTRLSIIDLSDAGRQPMCNEDGSVWLVFNGEIYNYRALRAQLERKGHSFRSSTDSEVIVHAYEEWGDACVRSFRGIFAFGIYDVPRRRLFLARDHLGVKPLYYSDQVGRFLFGSQPRAILEADGVSRALDPTAFSRFLAYGNVPGELCIFAGIAKLPAGHHLVHENGRTHTARFWDLRYQPVIDDAAEAEAAVREKVVETARAQEVSDVPVGVLASGGIDSTILVGCRSSGIDPAAVPTFTIGFEEPEKDERAYARQVARHYGTTHHERTLTYQEACRSLAEVVEAYDEPFDLNGTFPMYAVSRLVQEAGVKVVFGGDGGDELFTGYLRYESFPEKVRRRARKSAGVRGLVRRLLGRGFFDPARPRDLAALFFRYEGFLDASAQASLLTPSLRRAVRGDYLEPLTRHWVREYPVVTAAQVTDLHCYLVDHILCKVDRASMACGVEVRVPLLDPELVELVFSISEDVLFKHGERKALLKRAMSHCFPPEMDLNRKKGFSSPSKSWMEMGMSRWGAELVRSGHLVETNVLDRSAVTRIFEGGDRSIRIQLLLVSAELWARRWLAGVTDQTLYKDLASLTFQG